VHDFDMISVCMSKGMGSPAGSLLVGGFQDIEKAKEYNRMLGGEFDESSVLAACALVSLDGWEEHLNRDNENASFMAYELAEIPGVQLDPNIVETNILRFSVDQENLERAGAKDHNQFSSILKNHGILCRDFGNTCIRMITHRDISRQDCETAVNAFK